MQPFELGWQAGWRGDDPRTCPYEKMTREWNEWQRALSIVASCRNRTENLGPYEMPIWFVKNA